MGNRCDHGDCAARYGRDSEKSRKSWCWECGVVDNAYRGGFPLSDMQFVDYVALELLKDSIHSSERDISKAFDAAERFVRERHRRRVLASIGRDPY